VVEKVRLKLIIIVNGVHTTREKIYAIERAEERQKRKKNKDSCNG